MQLVRNIKAELVKLKYPPIIWLIGFVLIAVIAIVFAAHFIDVNRTAALGQNPWDKYRVAVTAIFSVFIAVPFIVLLISAGVFLDHQYAIWKFQYTVPMKRGAIFFSKLFAILALILMTFAGLVLGVILCAYFLDLLLPELEFRYYPMVLINLLEKLGHTFVALLGIIGIQYFLSLRFKGFLVPASFGVVAFVVGLILGTINNPISAYFPYSYPTIVQNHNMFNTDQVGIVDYGFFNSIELHSILYFVFFVFLAKILEDRRQVH